MLLKQLGREKKISPFHFCMFRKGRKVNPSGESVPSGSKTIRRKETMDACIKTHGGTMLNKDPVLFGMLDTLTSQFEGRKQWMHA